MFTSNENGNFVFTINQLIVTYTGGGYIRCIYPSVLNRDFIVCVNVVPFVNSFDIDTVFRLKRSIFHIKRGIGFQWENNHLQFIQRSQSTNKKYANCFRI